MRRVIALFLCILLFAVPAHAANAAQKVSTTIYVSENSSCQVAVTLDIRLDEPVRGLRFPLGQDIHAVTLNGSRAKLQQVDGLTFLDLSYLDGQIGVYPCSITYEISTVVQTDEKGKQLVTIPLLSGFPYPVEALDFSVTMPSEFTVAPQFRSGYHGQDIEAQMDWTVSGMQIQGTVRQTLKDSETLFLTLQAPEGMFPPVRTFGGSMVFDAIAMGVCAGLAFLLWVVMLGRLPHRAHRRATPPEGICVGQVAPYLVHRPADLPLTILQWAQLGYLTIRMPSSGKVFLYKKMDMGNERRKFERKCFRELFGSKTMLEATGHRFQSICDRVRAYSDRRTNGYRSKPGVVLVFRGISALTGLFAGVAMADAIATHHTWRVILMLLFGGLGLVMSWYIQEGMNCLHLRGRASLKLGILLSLVFLGGAVACKCLLYGLGAVGWNLFAGLCAAYGGRRSDNGRRIHGEIMGLRKYLRKTPGPELQRILTANPNYYYELAPYALALGLDKAFAARFGEARLPACTWLETGADVRTPKAWNKEVRKVVAAMNRKRKPTLAERIFGKH